MLELANADYTIYIRDEPQFIHSRQFAMSHSEYEPVHYLCDPQYATSAHSLEYNGPNVRRSCLILACGGPTGVQLHSAIMHDNVCILAVSAFIVALLLPAFDLVWATEADTATCFGVYHTPKYSSYISHGELEIARLLYDGQVIWPSSGNDIFTNGFQIFDGYIEAIDFNNEKYWIDIATGNSTIIKS